MPKWFNGEFVLNSPTVFNFLLGNRSAGKSFFFKQRFSRMALKTGHPFVYMRRNTVDLELATKEFLKDIGKYPEFDGFESKLKNKGRDLYIYKKADGEITEEYLIAYCYSLSAIIRRKSIPMDNVDYIFFDEFLPDDNKYFGGENLVYEPEQLLAFYMTVARGRGSYIRDNVKVICVANVVSRYNPYFSYFGIDLTGKIKYTNKEMSSRCEIIYNEEARDAILNSKLGGLISTTSYGQYAVGNEALRDDPTNVVDKIPGDAVYRASIYVMRWFSLWLAPGMLLYFRDCYDASCPARYAIGSFPKEEKVMQLPKSVADLIKRYYEIDAVRYETQRVKNLIGGYFEQKFIKRL